MQSAQRKYKTACITCRHRKVKCDKILPCRNCCIAEVECQYPSQVRTVNRPKRVEKERQQWQPKAASSVSTEQSVLSRLDRLECLLQKVITRIDADSDSNAEESPNDATCSANIDQHDDSAIPNPQTPGPIETEAQVTPDLNLDGSQMLWSCLSPKQGDDLEHWPPPSEMSNPTEDQNQAPYHKAATLDWSPVLPLETRRLCWSKYVENVDPLLKVLHRPTVEGMMLTEAPDISELDHSSIALVEAICLLALASMTDDEVALQLESDREDALQACLSHTEKALVAANILSDAQLRTLQATLLFLYFLKYKEDSRFGNIAAMSIFQATRMQLHRDAANSNIAMSQLELELRRRLWWQFVVLVDHPDESILTCFSVIQALGSDARLPLNVDDSELGVASNKPAHGRSGFTDLTFSLMQYEITKSFDRLKRDEQQQRLGRPGSMTQADLEARLQHLRRSLKQKYFWGPGRDTNLGAFAADTAVMMIAKRGYLLLASSAQMSEDWVLQLGAHVLELSRNLQKSCGFRQWHWLSATYFQWTVAELVLKGLSAKTRQSPAACRAWRAVDGLLSCWPESTQRSSKAVALRELMAFVHVARSFSLPPHGSLGPNAPVPVHYRELGSGLGDVGTETEGGHECGPYKSGEGEGLSLFALDVDQLSLDLGLPFNGAFQS